MRKVEEFLKRYTLYILDFGFCLQILKVSDRFAKHLKNRGPLKQLI